MTLHVVDIGHKLDCVHRLEKVGTVPCAPCSQPNMTVKMNVYLCRAEGGRPCVLRPVGEGPEQRFRDARPIVCATCPIRTPPAPPV